MRRIVREAQKDNSLPEKKSGNMIIFAIQVALDDKKVTAIVSSFDKERATDLAGLQIWKKKKGSDEWKKSAKVLWQKPIDMNQGKHPEKVLSFFVECT